MKGAGAGSDVAHVVPDVNVKQNAQRKFLELSVVLKCDACAFLGGITPGTA